MIYSEITTYSPVLDGEVTRLSTVDEHGGEFFCLIPRDRVKKWREVRERVLDDLANEIAAGAEPGQFIPRLED